MDVLKQLRPMYEYQRNSGRLFLRQQHLEEVSWQLQCLRKLRALPGVNNGSCGAQNCRLGIISNSSRILEALSKDSTKGQSRDNFVNKPWFGSTVLEASALRLDLQEVGRLDEFEADGCTVEEAPPERAWQEE